MTVPAVSCRNPVGSGDSYVAGVAAGLARHLSVEEVLRLGAACGTANAMEEESGFVRRETVESLLPRIRVEKSDKKTWAVETSWPDSTAHVLFIGMCRGDVRRPQK